MIVSTYPAYSFHVCESNDDRNISDIRNCIIIIIMTANAIHLRTYQDPHSGELSNRLMISDANLDA